MTNLNEAAAKHPDGQGAPAAKRLAGLLDEARRGDARGARRKWPRRSCAPLKVALADLQDLLQAHPVTLADVPTDIAELWITADGRARVEVLPKGDPNDNETLRQFARAVLKVQPDATGGPVSILESGDTIVRAFFEAGGWALLSIAILLWIVLRRFGDVLLTLVPLLLAGVVTLELCVLIGMPLNFANIIALPLLLGIGVAFKIYYIMAWRAGQTGPAAVEPDARGVLQRADHRDGVRQPVALEPSGHVEHGQAARAVAAHDACRRRAVPAGADGQAARARRDVRRNYPGGVVLRSEFPAVKFACACCRVPSGATDACSRFRCAHTPRNPAQRCCDSVWRHSAVVN